MDKTYQSPLGLPGLWAWGAFCILWGVLLWTLPDSQTLQDWAVLWKAPGSAFFDAFHYSPWFREIWSPDPKTPPSVAFRQFQWILWAVVSAVAFVFARLKQTLDSSAFFWGIAFLISAAGSEGIRSIVTLIFGVVAIGVVHFDAYAKDVSWARRGMNSLGAGFLSLSLGLVLGRAGLVIAMSGLAAVGLAVFVSSRSLFSILLSHLLFVACVFVFWIPYVYPLYQEYLSSGLNLEAFVLSQMAGHIGSLGLDPWTFLNSQSLGSTPGLVTTFLWVCPLVWILLRLMRRLIPIQIRSAILESDNKVWFWQGWAWAVSIWPLVSRVPEARPLAWMASFVMVSGFLALNRWSVGWQRVTGLMALGVFVFLLVPKFEAKTVLNLSSETAEKVFQKIPVRAEVRRMNR